jgi:hypothetical protein
MQRSSILGFVIPTKAFTREQPRHIHHEWEAAAFVPESSASFLPSQGKASIPDDILFFTVAD